MGHPYVHDLVPGNVAAAETGVPETVIRQWASRGKIRRYPNRWRSAGMRTMYALPEVRALAATYKATPQRAPKRTAA